MQRSVLLTIPGSRGYRLCALKPRKIIFASLIKVLQLFDLGWLVADRQRALTPFEALEQGTAALRVKPRHS